MALKNFKKVFVMFERDFWLSLTLELSNIKGGLYVTFEKTIVPCEGTKHHLLVYLSALSHEW